MECDVCAGTPGWYPIINSKGRELYNIRCPECCGSGQSSEPDNPQRRDGEVNYQSELNI